MLSNVDDRVGALLHGGQLLDAVRLHLEQRVVSLRHAALVLGERDATQARALLRQHRDAADLASNRLATGTRWGAP